ncbi:variable large family protein [Borrelia persica]|uniref:variable large family protein n=1 Tax=Borrelia persica TaxID=44448 RepID=UPI0004661BC0|nr:variable large family protein [Borrelia persica]
MKKPLGLLIITTSLFSGCDLVDKFIAENKDVSGNKDALIFNSMTNKTLSDQAVQLPQGKNSGIVSSVDGKDDDLAPGWYKISGFAGGGPLKGEKGETGSVSNLSGFGRGKTLRGIEEETHNFSVDFSEDSLSGMSGQSNSLVSEEEYYSNNIYFSEDSYNSISGLSGQNSSSLISSEEDFDIEINPNDKRGKIKEYFGKLKNKLGTFNKGINSSSIDIMITAVNKLVDATGDDNIGVGEISDSATKASQISDRKSVQDMIAGIREIVEIAGKSGVKIENQYIVDTPVVATNNASAPAALNGGSGSSLNDGGFGVGAGFALVKEVDKANAWAMLDKIRNANVANESISGKSSNDAGELITGYTSDDKGASAKSNADLAAAVALKAMSKSGKFSAYKDTNNNDDIAKIQEAAANAVKKVLSVLDSIITQTLQRISK